MKRALLLFCFLFLGCQLISVVGPIAQLGIMWVEGEAQKYYNTDQLTIYGAVKSSLSELDLKITDEETKGDTIYLKAGDKERFKIKICAVRERTTKLSVRVDFMGDKPYAEMLYRHVDQKQGVVQFVTLKELNNAIETRRRKS